MKNQNVKFDWLYAKFIQKRENSDKRLTKIPDRYRYHSLTLKHTHKKSKQTIRLHEITEFFIVPNNLNFTFLTKKTRLTSEGGSHIGIVVPEAGVGAALPIADIHRRVMVYTDEVDGSTDQLGLFFCERRNP
jgi:hypothetical protein